MTEQAEQERAIEEAIYRHAAKDAQFAIAYAFLQVAAAINGLQGVMQDVCATVTIEEKI